MARLMTALLKVKTDLLMAMDKGQVTLLVLLDLSSAFDTVEHEILLERLRSTVGLRWKAQQVSINGSLSKRFYFMCGVPPKDHAWARLYLPST